MYSRKYELLNNREWLFEMYITQHKSLNAIAKLVGAKTSNSVRQALLGFGLAVRNSSEGLRQEDFFHLDRDVLTGSLLGDGFLEVWNEQSDKSYPRFCKRNKFYDHVAFVAQRLFERAWEDRINEEYRATNGKICKYFSLRSHVQSCLLEWFRKWYPKDNNYEKIVPRDISLNEKILLHWFLDDGSTSFRKRKTKQVRMVFCSESFSKNDQEFLCGLLKDKFDLNARVRPYAEGTGWRIHIPQSQTDEFFRIVGPAPIKSLEYKWK